MDKHEWSWGGQSCAHRHNGQIARVCVSCVVWSGAAAAWWRLLRLAPSPGAARSRSSRPSQPIKRPWRAHHGYGGHGTPGSGRTRNVYCPAGGSGRQAPAGVGWQTLEAGGVRRLGNRSGRRHSCGISWQCSRRRSRFTTPETASERVGGGNAAPRPHTPPALCRHHHQDGATPKVATLWHHCPRASAPLWPSLSWLVPSKNPLRCPSRPRESCTAAAFLRAAARAHERHSPNSFCSHAPLGPRARASMARVNSFLSLKPTQPFALP